MYVNIYKILIYTNILLEIIVGYICRVTTYKGHFYFLLILINFELPQSPMKTLFYNLSSLCK